MGAVISNSWSVGGDPLRSSVNLFNTQPSEAGKIALKGGAADVVVSDWLWVARERALGDNLVFYPYSSALGAVMVLANAQIRSVGDLKNKKLGIAGGPLFSRLPLRASRPAQP
jgi:NitT/TauT family transport system substrate-binding protein